jgi:hypothetical protein
MWTDELGYIDGFWNEMSQVMGWMLLQAFPSGQQMTSWVPVLLRGRHWVPVGQHQEDG